MISIIIPTFNEEKNIGDLITYLQRCVKHKPAELLVVDGGSTDSTCEIVKSTGAKLVHAPKPGRSKQMNYAASVATGDILYFVHADTQPPKDFYSAITTQINADNEAGCFTSIFDWNHPFLRFCNFFSRLPFWFCRGGGQTLYVKKSLFNKLNGFDETMILMEEYEFISRLKKASSFAIIKKNAVTSARDYRKNGAVRLQLIYSVVFLMYALGMSQNKMLEFVRKHVQKA